MCGARSGDKGGNANVGVWTRSDDAYHWLAATLTVEAFASLVTEAAELEVLRYELPNLRALNFVVVGLLGDGVASSTRYDPQAKGLGEYLRSRLARRARLARRPARSQHVGDERLHASAVLGVLVGEVAGHQPLLAE